MQIVVVALDQEVLEVVELVLILLLILENQEERVILHQLVRLKEIQVDQE